MFEFKGDTAAIKGSFLSNNTGSSTVGLHRTGKALSINVCLFYFFYMGFLNNSLLGLSQCRNYIDLTTRRVDSEHNIHMFDRC